MKDNTCDLYSFRMSFFILFPFFPFWNLFLIASAFIFDRPVFSPIGMAPDFTILIPLYSEGLWEAVIIAPGSFRKKEAKYNTGVETMPMSITLEPCSVTPLVNLSLSMCEELRMSCPRIKSLHFNALTIACPVLYAISPSSFVPKMQRMSFGRKQRPILLLRFIDDFM